MQFAQQQQIIAQLQSIFNDAGALAAYMRYTMGGSAEYADMLTLAEIGELEAKGVLYEEVCDAAYAENADSWLTGLEFASKMLGRDAAAMQANKLLEQLKTSEQEVFEGIDEMVAGEFTERGEFMQELWDAF